MRWDGPLAVIALPEQVDVANAGQIREELLSVINRGARALIADMTATISCDHAGADALVRAYQRTVAAGTELRLVVTAQIVARVLSITGLDRLVSIYPSLDAATAARPPAPVLALVAGIAAAGTGGHAPPRRARQATAPIRATGAPMDGAVITPAVVWKLVDALQDAAVTAEQARRSLQLLDTVVTSLFAIGLGLHAAMDLPAEASKQHIAGALSRLDDTICEIRDTAFTTTGQSGSEPVRADVTP